MARPAYMALLLAVAVLALAGCGGDEDDSPSTTPATAGASGPTGTTTPRTGASGATGATGERRPTGARPNRTGTKRESDGETGTGGSGAATPPPAETPAREKPKRQSLLSPKERKQVGRELKKQARLVCEATTLEVLAKQYGIKSRDPDEVARAYAATYPAGIRKAVAAGCKAGLEPDE